MSPGRIAPPTDQREAVAPPAAAAVAQAPGVVLLDALPSAAFLVDDDGVVVLANPRAAEVLVRPLDQLAGARIGELLAPLDWLLRHATLPRTERSLEIELPTGRRITIGYSLGEAGGPSPQRRRYAVLFQDITDWQRVRDERDRLLKLAAVGSALPTLLHELKNPLASITAATEVLLEEVGPGSVRDQLHAVLSEVRRMKLSLDGVGTMGRSLRSSRHAAIDHACREAWQVMAARARGAGLHSHLHVDDMPLLPIDAGVVSGLVYNLMVNAIQACSAGHTVNLHAGLRDSGSRFWLTVVDNGPGMSAEVYQQCTDLFFTTKRNGSGIGLALCRRAAEEAGGGLVIESVVGFGTSVTVEVPLAPPPSR
jgi:signal transduction histidine kinase